MRNRLVVVAGVLALTVAPLAAGDGTAEKANEVFEELTKDGVAVGGGHRVRLPAPSMADDLDARSQRAVLDHVAGSNYCAEDLLRRSLVAPYVVKLRDVTAEPEAPAFGVDLWFVAHGDFACLNADTLLAFRDSARKEARTHVLTAAELARRKLTDRSGPGRNERYGHACVTLLDRVQLDLTLHTQTTRRRDSLLSAARVDPRFRDDADFPNQWRRLDGGGDRPKAGPAHPYGGAAAFLKITKLLEPEGALFAELHLVVTEPRGWFGGANLLRSKVPLGTLAAVRSFRRELAGARK
jgi:hypothetical protein